MIPFNPMQLMAMMSKGGNPQQMAMMLLNQMGGNNPMMSNLKTMVQNNDTKGIENFARNLAKERGIDPEQAMQDLKRQFGGMQ